VLPQAERCGGGADGGGPSPGAPAPVRAGVPPGGTASPKSPGAAGSGGEEVPLRLDAARLAWRGRVWGCESVVRGAGMRGRACLVAHLPRV
jgi:hypothetical protein